MPATAMEFVNCPFCAVSDIKAALWHEVDCGYFCPRCGNEWKDWRELTRALNGAIKEKRKERYMSEKQKLVKEEMKWLLRKVAKLRCEGLRER